MDANEEAELLRALEGRQIVEFVYKGKRRTGEPHVLGLRGGKKQLLFYQTGGESSSGGLPEWRRVNLEDVWAFKVRGETFPGGRQPTRSHHAAFDEVLYFVP